MQIWVVICGALLLLVGADECPDAGRCPKGQTCCSGPADGYECCLFHQAECCEDHVHCCPAGTLCHADASSCVNNSVSIPWAERTSADQPRVSKSFRMIKSYEGEDEDNVCPDQSRCLAEFSCMKALKGFGCCPLAKGVSCSDGKHCCPEDHQCSFDGRSCIKKEIVTTVLCNDGVSECPNGATCCESSEGTWGCCPIPKAVCCVDKLHCCSEGTTCDVKHMKCISASEGDSPMWDKFPARLRADWENQRDGKKVISKEAETEKTPDVTTAGPVPTLETEVSLRADTESTSTAQEIPTFTSETPTPEETTTLNQETTSMTTAEEEFSTQQTTEEEDYDDGDENRIQCDDHTSCPQDTTCCFMASCKKWGCCPLPKAVCCARGSHCCPEGYRCEESKTSCVKDETEIPWYTKIPATTSVRADPGLVMCDAENKCPEHTSCCRLFTGEWGCCPLQNAVCCPDMEHCCPQGYACDIVSRSCQKTIILQLETIPLTPIYLPEYRLQLAPLKDRDILCDDQSKCKYNETCCRTSPTTWGCCPSPNAVCCSDMKRCCPSNYSCSDGGACVRNTGPSWNTWNFFLNYNKRALNL
ncbi:granulin a [Austrofundulus limnaeus]|uniref:Granulin a n=1 Tax=Austrofundulus limnaeus TaxID=52670 RepID=A0A2I4BDE2_AUSLI|nr:PREDICTED: granulins-like [Austrofundulus limnaeus]